MPAPRVDADVFLVLASSSISLSGALAGPRPVAFVLAGKAGVLKARKGFFNAFPNYRNDWSQVLATGGTLIGLGWLGRRDEVSEWRVYDDTRANRDQLGIANESD